MPTQYPLDLSGTALTNRITNESITFTQERDRFFVPTGGPYFSESIAMHDASNGQLMVPNVDYKCLHLIVAASVEATAQICSVIHVIRPTTGILLTRQVIGGLYSETTSVIRDLINTFPVPDNTVEWGHIFNKPTEFPPAYHFHDINDFTGWNDVVFVLEEIRKAIMLGNTGLISNLMTYLQAYITQELQGLTFDYATAAEIAAGVVSDKPIAPDQFMLFFDAITFGFSFEHASVQDITDGIVTDKYMAPAEFKLFLDALVGDFTFDKASAVEIKDAVVDDKYISPAGLHTAYPHVKQGPFLGINGGLEGDGLAETTGLRLNTEYMQSNYVPAGVLPVSRVGNASEKYLPIDVGYFSIRYPRQVSQPTGSAYIEADGRLNYLTPATNGEVIRLVYAYIENFTGGNTELTPTNVVYAPMGLNPDEYIQSLCPASATAMIGEIWAENALTGIPSFVEFVFIKLNGTFDAESHELMRMGTSLETILLDRMGSFINNGPTSVRLACPVAAVIPGFQAAVFMGVPRTMEIIPINVNLVAQTVEPFFGSWSSKRNGSTVNTGSVLKFYSDVVSDTDNQAFFFQPDLVDYSGFVTNRSTQQLTLSIGQDGTKLRIRVGQLITVNTQGRSTSPDLAYSFNTVWGSQIATLDDQYAAAGAITALLNGNQIVFSTDAYEHWKTAIGSVGIRNHITILENGAEVFFLSNNPTSGGGFTTTRYHKDFVRKTAYESTNPYAFLGRPISLNTTFGAFIKTDVNENLFLPQPTPVCVNGFGALIKPGIIYGWGDDRGQSRNTDNGRPNWLAKFNTALTKSYRLGENGIVNGAQLSTERFDLYEKADRLPDTMIFIRENSVSRTTCLVYTGEQGQTWADVLKDGDLAVDANNTIVRSQPYRLSAAAHQTVHAQADIILHNGLGLVLGTIPDYKWVMYVVTTGIRPKVLLFVGGFHLDSTTGKIALKTVLATGAFTNNSVPGLYNDLTTGNSFEIIDTDSSSPNTAFDATSFAIVPKQLQAMAVFQSSNGNSEYIIRRPLRVTGPSGTSNLGMQHLIYDDETETWQAGFVTDEGNSQNIVPAYFPARGLGYITTTLGYGVPYVFVPWNSATPSMQPDVTQAFLVTSPKPADGFILNITKPVSVFMLGRMFTIPKQVIDLATIKVVVANQTFYVYATLVAGQATLTFEDQPLSETASRAFLGELVTDAEGVIANPLLSVSRLDNYRVSETPVGKAISVSPGLPTDTEYLNWALAPAAGGANYAPYANTVLFTIPNGLPAFGIVAYETALPASHISGIVTAYLANSQPVINGRARVVVYANNLQSFFSTAELITEWVDFEPVGDNVVFLGGATVAFAAAVPIREQYQVVLQIEADDLSNREFKIISGGQVKLI